MTLSYLASFVRFAHADVWCYNVFILTPVQHISKWIWRFICPFYSSWLCSFRYTQCSGQHSSTLLLGNMCKHFRWAYTKGGMNASRGIHMFRFRRQGQTGFQGGGISLHFYQECSSLLLLVPCFCQNLIFFLYIRFFFFNFCGIDCQKWDY